MADRTEQRAAALAQLIVALNAARRTEAIAARRLRVSQARRENADREYAQRLERWAHAHEATWRARQAVREAERGAEFVEMVNEHAERRREVARV